ncbi:FG-GAP-like repeat-containing protein [Chryseobacterium sp. T1]
MKLKISFLFFVGTAAFYHAQNFVEQTTQLQNFYYSSSDVGDFDGDGQLDLVVTGALDTDENEGADTSVTYIYKNNNGKLTEHQVLEMPVHLGDVRFIDIDNDGDLDIVSVGLSYEDIVNYKTYVYLNDNNTFKLASDDGGKIYSSIEIADYNHDGKMDYFINGIENKPGEGFLFDVDFYKNIGGKFEKQIGIIPGSQNGSFKVADFNNDQQLDIIMSGLDINYNPFMTLYTNDGGKLIEKQTFNPLSYSSLAVEDFDGDGLLDIIAIGQDEEYEAVFRFYKNNPDGIFTETDLPHEPVSNSSGSKAIDTGDINNDGYPDVVITGDNEDGNSVNKIYLYNPETKGFDYLAEKNIIPLGGTTNLQLADFNNDNQLDILVSGFDWKTENLPTLTKLYYSNQTNTNEKPTPPTTLTDTTIGNRINLSWDGATDDKTPTKGLNYEISVGTSPNKSDIAKYVVTTNQWFLELENTPEKLYWSVKSIDAGKRYSDASVVKEINKLSTKDVHSTKLDIYPNPVKDIVNVTSNKSIKGFALFDASGKLIKNYPASKTINMSEIKKGFYILTITFEDTTTINKKIIKE